MIVSSTQQLPKAAHLIDLKSHGVYSNTMETTELKAINTVSDCVSNNMERLCDPCQNENETTAAIGYCIECEEYLCCDCTRVHGRLSLTRQHAVRTGAEMSDKTDRLHEAAIYRCAIHTDQDLEYFCKSHGELSCFICKSIIHNECMDIEMVSEICDQIDSAEETENIKHETDNLKESVKNTSLHVKRRLESIKLNHQEANAVIKAMRKQVNDHLDAQETPVRREIDCLRKSDSEKMKLYGNKCKDISYKINALEKSRRLTMSKPYSKQKSFMATILAKTLIRTSEHDLAEIRENDSIKRYKFEPSNELKQFNRTVTNIGRVSVNSYEIRTPKFLKELNVKRESDNSCCITGMTLLKDNILAIVDSNNRSLKLIDLSENTVITFLAFDTPPWGVACIADSRLVVSRPEEQSIATVAVVENCLQVLEERIIKVQGKCYGIVIHDGKMLVAFNEPAKVEMLDASGSTLKVFKIKTTLQNNNPCHIAMDSFCHVIFVCYIERGLIIRLSLDNSNEENYISSYHYEAIATDITGALFSHHRTSTISVRRFTKNSKVNTSDSELLSINDVSSLAYCNVTNTLFVGRKGNTISMYYVV